jgi:hypothetical protein
MSIFRLWANKSDCGCDQPKHVGYAVKRNIAASPRREMYEGTDYLIVPIVLLKQTVVNGAYVDASELIAPSWNGVPVTVHHPQDDGSAFISANSPQVLSKYHVGRIFNAELDGDTLKGEAWIEVERANKVMPALVDRLENNEQMDVSTGYLAKDRKISGSYGGKPYTLSHHDLKPDHLALLPDSIGACSWDDGCGVRANESSGSLKQALNMIVNAIFERKEAEMTAKPVTKESLKAAFNCSDAEADRMLAGFANATPAPAATPAAVTPPPAPVAQPVSNAAPAVTTLSAEDAEALAFARKFHSDQRARLIADIVANSTMTDAQLQPMTVATLETIANGLPKKSVAPAPDFSGRIVGNATYTNAAEVQKVADDMLAPKLNFAAPAGKAN